MLESQYRSIGGGAVSWVGMLRKGCKRGFAVGGGSWSGKQALRRAATGRASAEHGRVRGWQSTWEGKSRA